jgi:hypothetical protein
MEPEGSLPCSQQHANGPILNLLNPVHILSQDDENLTSSKSTASIPASTCSQEYCTFQCLVKLPVSSNKPPSAELLWGLMCETTKLLRLLGHAEGPPDKPLSGGIG